MKKLFNYIHNDLYLEVFCLILFILSFCFEPIKDVFIGYGKILTSSSILLTDYVYIGGVGATLLNVASVLLFNIIMLKLLGVKTSGAVYCGIIMICGFSFFGKNIINTLPIYLGIWLYSKYKKIPFKSLIIAILLSTGISPLISYCFFGFGLEWYFALPLGLLSGIIVGFIVPAYSAHTLAFHEGYNLYNTGFALGIISAVFYALFLMCGLKVETVKLYDGTSSNIFYVLLGGISIIFIIIAIIGDKGVFKKYFQMLKTSGRLISDYVREFGVETVLLNFGILGVLLFTLFISCGIPMNGILFGSILAVLGVASFGLHLRNAVPVWIGCALAIIIMMAVRQDFSIDINRDMSILVAFVFASALAPISGKFGFVYGIAGGIIHIALTPIAVSLQGGFDLYNNGFAAGFEASVLAICGDKIFHKERRRNARKSKNM